MALLPMEQCFESMEVIVVGGYSLVSLHMVRLEHPSPLPLDKEGQKPLVKWCCGQNIQPDTSLESVGHT